MFKLGLIINPIAGMGGSVGLKGTDGKETLDLAIQKGAIPTSTERAALVLNKLTKVSNQFKLITCPGVMGEDIARKCRLNCDVLSMSLEGNTNPEDTRNASNLLFEQSTDLLLFVGGDGTARDIASVIGEKQLSIGVPAGVKIHSSVFALSPLYAAEITESLIRGRKTRPRLAEVMDIDEEAFRAGEVRARLFGYLQVPGVDRGMQALKAGSSSLEIVKQQAIASFFFEDMSPDLLYLIGPGTTTRELLRKFGHEGTLLGIDALKDGAIIGQDLNESQCIELLDKYKLGQARIVVTPIGGQGFIFGRGNQQLSPKVIRRVTPDGIVVVSTPDKLHALQGKPLRIDTGDPELDIELAGVYHVLTGYRESTYYWIEN